MGINKGNIRYSIHYGIPESLEALYQEAGRAGCDGKRAGCYILISEEIVSQEQLDVLFDLNTSVSEINEIENSLGYRNKKDVFTNLYLWLRNTEGSRQEINNMNQVLNQVTKNGETIIYGKLLGLRKLQLEKALYKLGVLGIVDDWVIEEWNENNPIIKVYLNNFNKTTVEQYLVKYLSKYGTYLDFSTEKNKNSFGKYYDIYNKVTGNEIQKYIEILVEWQYENILYNRRKQIQTVYEKCLEFQREPDRLKQFIEAYFHIGDTSYIYDHIIDYPTDYDAWFKVFFEPGGVIIKNTKWLSDDKIALVRLLESISRNIGLNLIFGLQGLLTGDYSREVEQRLEHAISEIATMSDQEIDDILNNIYLLSSNMRDEHKEHLAGKLISHFPSRRYEIYDGIKDEYSLNVVLDSVMKRIENKIGDVI